MKYHPVRLAFSHLVVAAHTTKRKDVEIRQEYSHERIIASFRQRIIRSKERTLLETQLAEVRLILNRLSGQIPEEIITRMKDRVRILEEKVQKI